MMNFGANRFVDPGRIADPQEGPLSDGEVGFLWWFIQGGIMDQTVRERLHRGWDLCARHSFAFLSVNAVVRFAHRAPWRDCRRCASRLASLGDWIHELCRMIGTSRLIDLPDESLGSRIDCGCPQTLLNAHQLVVFLHPLTATRRTGLQMSGAEGDGEVSDEAVHGLAAAMRHHRAPVRVVGKLHCRAGFGQAADLIELDQHGVGHVFLDAARDAFHVGDEQVVTDQLDPIAEYLVESLPAGPVVFGQAVFQHRDRVFRHPVGIHRNHFFGADLAILGAQMVKAILVETAGGRVQCQHHVFAGPKTGPLDRLQDEWIEFWIPWLSPIGVIGLR